MTSSFFHIDRHWDQSRGVTQGAVVLSELPRGDSPVIVTTRSINFVVDGVERYELDGRSYVLRAGEFLVIEAGVAARAVLPERGITRGLCIYLPPTGTMTASAPREGDPAILRALQLSARTVPFGRMLERIGARLSRDRTLAPAQAQALIERTAREFDRFESSVALDLLKVEAVKPSTRHDLLQRIYRARAYLHDHPRRLVTLDELATVAGMSQFHLARSFRAVMGLPPAAYHAELRVRLADRALRNGAMSSTQAASFFGFAETSSFSRAFLRIAGVTPSQAARGATAPGLMRPFPL